MSISVKVLNSAKQIAKYNVEKGRTLLIRAQDNVNYQLIDEVTGFAPQNILVKRKDNDLFIMLEDGDLIPDIIIEGYYENGEEVTNLLVGQHENGAIYAYVPESGQKFEAISLLAEEVTAPQALGGEKVATAFWSFNPWWLAAGLLGAGAATLFVASQKSSSGSNASSKPASVVFDSKTDFADGGISFTIPNGAKEVEVTFTPEGSSTPITVKITKQADGTYTSSDSRVTVDGNKVSIAENSVADKTDVTAVAVYDNGQKSDPSKTVSNYDEATNESLKDQPADEKGAKYQAPKVVSMDDKSNPADGNPESFVLEGRTQPNADVTIKDPKGNIIGTGKADKDGFYRVPVTEHSSFDIKTGDELTVITKADGFAPSTDKAPITADIPMTFSGDKKGPETPVIETDNNGNKVVKFPPADKDGKNDTKEIDVAYQPKGQDEKDSIKVTKDDKGNVGVVYDPAGSDTPPVNIEKTKDEKTGGTNTHTDFVPSGEDSPINIDVSRDKDGKVTETKANLDDTTVKVTTDENGKPVTTVENPNGTTTTIKTDENGKTTVETTDKDGKTAPTPENVKVDENGNVTVTTDTNNPNSPTISVDNTGKVSVNTGGTEPTEAVVEPDGTIKLDTDNNKDTPPNVEVTEGEIKIDNDRNDKTNPVVVDISGGENTGDVTIPPETLETGKTGGTEITAEGKDLAGNSSGTKTEIVTDKGNNAELKAPELQANDDGTVTATMPKDVPNGTAVVFNFNDENGNPVEVTLTKGDSGWTVEANKADLVTINNDGTVTILEDSVADASTVFAHSHKANDPTSKSATTSAKVLPHEVTSLKVDKITSYNDSNPAKLGDITKVKVEGTTDPNAKVQIKDKDGNVIAEGTADQAGKFAIEFAEPTGTTFEGGKTNLTVEATAPTKKPSNPAKETVPEIAKDGTGYIGDTANPEKPTLEVGPSGNNKINVTPTNPQPGDEVTVGVTDNKGNPVELVFNVDENGKLVPSEKNPETPKATISPDGKTISFEPADIKDNTPITAVVKDISGKVSEPAVGNSGFDKVTPQPTIATIKATDTSEKADKNPEEFTLTGKAEPGATVIVTDAKGNELGRVKADDKGDYTVTVKEKGVDIQSGDDIKVVAQKLDDKGQPLEAASQPTSAKVPELTVADHTDKEKPTAPTFGQETETHIPVNLPKDSVAGDTATITVGDKTVTLENTGNPEEPWKVVGGDKGLVEQPITSDTVNIPKTVAPKDTTIKAEVTDNAGNKSEPATKTVGAEEPTPEQPTQKTPTPVIAEIAPVDKSKPADKIAEEITVTGKVPDVPVGTPVTITNEKGDVIGTGKTTDDEGNFSIVIPNGELDKPLQKDDVIKVTAEEKGRLSSDVGTKDGGETKVPEVPATAEGHPNDPTGPSAPELIPVAGTGAVILKFPTDANPGDTVEVSYKKEDGTDAKVIFEKQTDGSWESKNPTELPSVVENLDSPQLIIPENHIQDGQPVTAKSIDAIIKDSFKEATAVTAGNDAKTATPTNLEIVSKDTDANGEVDSFDISGKVEAGTKEVIIYRGETELARVPVKDDNTFTATITETMGDITADETITVVAKDPNKEVSDKAPVKVPDVMQPPANIKVESYNTESQANVTPEKAVITGTHPVPGTVIEARDPKTGELLGSGEVQPDGTFTITLEQGKDKAPEDIKTGDTFNLVATDPKGTKDPSAAVTTPKVEDVPTGAGTEKYHPNDTTAPTAPTVTPAAKDNDSADSDGSLTVTFPPTSQAEPNNPAAAVPGDVVEVKYTPTGATEEVTASYTLGDDFTWKPNANNPQTAPAVTQDANNKPAIKFDEGVLEDNTPVTASTKDQVGKTAEHSGKAPFDDKSATPTITEIKGIDVVKNGEDANTDPEQMLVKVDTNKDGKKAPEGSIVKIYAADDLTKPIAEGKVDKDGFANILVKEDPNGTPTTISVDDKFVATVQEVGEDKKTPVKAESQPSDPKLVEAPKNGTIIDPNNDGNITADELKDQKGGHIGDNTAPDAYKPTVKPVTSGDNQGGAEVELPKDAPVGYRAEVTITPEKKVGADGTPTNEDNNVEPLQEVTVTLTKQPDGSWKSDKPALIGDVAKPTDPNAKPTAVINKETVKDKSDVSAVIKDLADNVSPASTEKTGYDETTAAPQVTKTLGISTNPNFSDSIPEKLKITGTAEKGAKVTAYLGDTLIGEATADSVTGEFTLETDPTKYPQGFTFDVTAGSETQISLKAELVDQKAPSEATTTNAVKVPQGTDDATKALHHPADSTAPTAADITELPKGFGGAKITLPSTENETFLEVTVTYPPANNPAGTETVTLTWENNQWKSSNTEVIAAPTEKDGKFTAYLPADKVAAKNGEQANTVSVVTKDYAGNSSSPDTATLNEPAGNTNTEKTVEGNKDRTDVPTLVAGSTVNAGDMVATPGKDNDKLLVKYTDEQDKPKQITVVKDMDAGEWRFEGESHGAKVDPATGKVTIPADNVKDLSKVEAIGYKGDQASDKPYTTESTMAENVTTLVDQVIAYSNIDDETPNQADTPTIKTEGELEPALLGGAKVEPGPDNVEVLVGFTGYTVNGNPTTQKTTNAEETPMVLVAKKDPVSGEWTLYVATEANYNANKTDPAKLENVLEVAPNNIATIDASGVITLKPSAVKDGSDVTATGYNAAAVASEPAPAKNVGAELDKDVDADEPTISQLSNGKVSATPVGDNTKMEVEYTKPNGDKAKVNVEKVGDKWKFEGSDLTADPATGLITKDGVTLNPTDGTVVIPKEQLQVPSTASAVGTNADNYTSDKVDTPVVKDPTLTADAPLAYAQGNNVVVVPGDDNDRVEINTKPAKAIVKQPDGTWKFEGDTTPVDQATGLIKLPNGITLDPKTGTVTIPKANVPEAGIVATGTDGNGSTAQSNGGEPVKLNIPTDPTPDTVEKPDIAAINDGADKGGVLITPKEAEHTRLSVTYEKEPKDGVDRGTGTLTAVKNPQTGKWELEPLFENGESVPVPASVATINPDSGAITLYAYEVKDNKPVSAVGTNSAGKSSEPNTMMAPSNPNAAPTDNEQPKVDPTENGTITENNKPIDTTVTKSATFRNDGVGKVVIKPSDNLDYLEFKVALDADASVFSPMNSKTLMFYETTIKMQKELDGTWRQTDNNKLGFKVKQENGTFVLESQNVTDNQNNSFPVSLSSKNGHPLPDSTYMIDADLNDGINRDENTVSKIRNIKLSADDTTLGEFSLRLPTGNNNGTEKPITDQTGGTTMPDYVGQPKNEADPANRGGMIVGKSQEAADKTNKFTVTYLDENSTEKVLTFEKGTAGWAAAANATLPEGVKVDANTGLVTMAPAAVKDGSKVIVRAYDVKGKLRALKENTADFEASVEQTIAEKNAINVGDAWVAPGDETQTKKFEVAFTDEDKIAHTLTVNNNNGTWSIDQALLAQDPSLKKLVDSGLISVNAETGKVTFDREALLDESRVVIRPYNAKGQMVSNKVASIMTDIDKIVTAVDKPDWSTTEKAIDPLPYLFISDRGYTNGLRDLLNDIPKGVNNKPLPYANGYPDGRDIKFGAEDDIMKVDQSIGYTSLIWTRSGGSIFPLSFAKEDSKYLRTLNFFFNEGDDTLVVGRDLGTFNVMEDGRKVTTVNMGKGNDILVVGAHNDWYKVATYKDTGKLSLLPSNEIDGRDWKLVEGLNMGWKHGGQLSHSAVVMGDGDDTVLLKGINAGVGYGSFDSTIDLGEGNNRLILSPENNNMKAFHSSTVKAGDGVDVVSGGLFNGGSNVYLGGGNDEFVAKELADATIQLGNGNDWAEVTAFIREGAKVDLGSGNDVFKQGAQGNDAELIQGGSGIDLYWLASSGANGSTSNVQGFENILMSSNTKFSLKSDHIMSLEGPMKITAYAGTSGQTVDFGINGDLKSNVQSGGIAETGPDAYAWLKKEGTVTENGVTYNKYYYSNGSSNVPEVWIDTTITHII